MSSSNIINYALNLGDINHEEAYNCLYSGYHYFFYMDLFCNVNPYSNDSIKFSIETFTSTSSNLIEKGNFHDDVTINTLTINIHFEPLAYPSVWTIFSSTARIFV
jgi:hypothetical protein